WIAPNAVTAPQAPSRGRFLLRARRELIWPRVEITQDGRRLWFGRLPRVMPGRSAALGTRWMTSVDPAAGPVTVSVLRARRRH
ncbi:MAG: oxidoreductase, partial [Thermoleophilia bacterium]